jgi:hypothetical protein
LGHGQPLLCLVFLSYAVSVPLNASASAFSER